MASIAMLLCLFRRECQTEMFGLTEPRGAGLCAESNRQGADRYGVNSAIGEVASDLVSQERGVMAKLWLYGNSRTVAICHDPL